MSMMIYTWGPRSFSVAAQIVGEEVARLAGPDGRCEPRDLVDKARQESSPLHPLFTWVDGIAAEKWRQQEARQVIRSITTTIVRDDRQVTAPAFVSVKTADEAGSTAQGYRRIDRVLAVPEQKAYVLDDALRYLVGIQKRYAAYTEYAEIWSAIDRAVAQATARQELPAVAD